MLSQAAGGKPVVIRCAQSLPLPGACATHTPRHLREDVHCLVVHNGEILLRAGGTLNVQQNGNNVVLSASEWDMAENKDM